MSTPAAINDGERVREGFGKYIRRFRTVLRRGSAARGSVASPGASTPAVLPPVANTTSGISSSDPPIQDAPATKAAELSSGQRAAGPLEARPTDQYIRLKAMFAKYNMDFDESSWPAAPSKQGVRVEKPIRMRVRIVCHYCRTNYTASRECTNCQHRRCEKCTRVPPKRRPKGEVPETERLAQDRPEGLVILSVAGRHTAVDAGGLSADEAEDEAEVSRSGLKLVPKRPKRRKEAPLVVPSRTGGQDLVRKEALQRVHRTCCKCRRPFVRDSNECPQCSHLRCITCPRIPPKLDKWPAGYPGDVIPAEPERAHRQWKKAKIRVRWTCHECRKLFMEGEKDCANCSHTRCTDCQREPPKRPIPQFSAEVVTSVQERLAAVGEPSRQPDIPEASAVAASSSKEESKEEQAIRQPDPAV